MYIVLFFLISLEAFNSSCGEKRSYYKFNPKEQHFSFKKRKIGNVSGLTYELNNLRLKKNNTIPNFFVDEESKRNKKKKVIVIERVDEDSSNELMVKENKIKKSKKVIVIERSKKDLLSEESDEDSIDEDLLSEESDEDSIEEDLLSEESDEDSVEEGRISKEDGNVLPHYEPYSIRSLLSTLKQDEELYFLDENILKKKFDINKFNRILNRYGEEYNVKYLSSHFYEYGGVNTIIEEYNNTKTPCINLHEKIRLISIKITGFNSYASIARIKNMVMNSVMESCYETISHEEKNNLKKYIIKKNISLDVFNKITCEPRREEGLIQLNVNSFKTIVTSKEFDKGRFKINLDNRAKSYGLNNFHKTFEETLGEIISNNNKKSIIESKCRHIARFFINYNDKNKNKKNLVARIKSWIMLSAIHSLNEGTYIKEKINIAPLVNNFQKDEKAIECLVKKIKKSEKIIEIKSDIFRKKINDNLFKDELNKLGKGYLVDNLYDIFKHYFQCEASEIKKYESIFKLIDRKAQNIVYKIVGKRDVNAKKRIKSIIMEAANNSLPKSEQKILIKKNNLISKEGLRKLTQSMSSNEKKMILDSQMFAKELDEDKLKENLNKNGSEYGINNLYYLFSEKFVGYKEAIKDKKINFSNYFSKKVRSIISLVVGGNRNSTKFKNSANRIKNIIIKSVNSSLPKSEQKILNKKMI